MTVKNVRNKMETHDCYERSLAEKSGVIALRIRPAGSPINFLKQGGGGGTLNMNFNL